jgi:hypothetical protein
VVGTKSNVLHTDTVYTVLVLYARLG